MIYTYIIWIFIKWFYININYFITFKFTFKSPMKSNRNNIFCFVNYRITKFKLLIFKIDNFKSSLNTIYTFIFNIIKNTCIHMNSFTIYIQIIIHKQLGLCARRSADLIRASSST